MLHCYISISLKWKLRNNIDVFPYRTLRVIMKYVSRPESAAAKEIDIESISPIFYVRNIDIVLISARPPLVHSHLVLTHLLFEDATVSVSDKH